jgi:hypothetical protein
MTSVDQDPFGLTEPSAGPPQARTCVEADEFVTCAGS